MSGRVGCIGVLVAVAGSITGSVIFTGGPADGRTDPGSAQVMRPV